MGERRSKKQGAEEKTKKKSQIEQCPEQWAYR